MLGKLAGLLKSVKFKGDFSIITNQPLSTTVVKDIARLIRSGSKPAKEDEELFGKLTKALGLTARQLVIFLKAWDLTGFASASRLAMESEVIQRLAGMADADARDDAKILQNRVATLMLPESRNDPAVTREVLSVWLGAGSQGMLFPAQSQIKPTSRYVRRAVIDDLDSKLAPPQTKPLRLHAGGGCGKTSLICDLGSALPPESEIFIYDCYGGGLFLTSDQKRHLPEQAFTQLGNELAARFRTPLVVRRQRSIDVFEAFRNRVKVAAGVLKERNTDARLVLCFDAVDNARTGSRHWREPCFLDVLSQASAWPDNVRILVSCRTARRDEVGDKQLYDDVEIPGFDIDEVRQLVALWQPKWSPDLATIFENLTGGNPRRLVYAIEDLPSNGEMQAVERLMPKAEGINPLFEQRVNEAGKHLGNAKKVWEVLDALARLPRPIPEEVLSKLVAIAPADIKDIATDVGGIVERDEGWSFHDEDFEAFVIERPDSDGKALLERAADLVLATRLTDRYAAVSAAEVLASANRLDDLYALVTQEQKPSTVLTSLEAQFVWSRQLSLAIRCCRTTADVSTACSLLIASAEAIQRTKLLEDLTVQNLDLSVRFAAEEANRLVMVGQCHRNKRPQLRTEFARQAAPEHPETAKAHLRWWRAHLRELDENGTIRFRVSASDIANEYQAYAVLVGEERAFARLFEWRPKSALQPVFAVLAARAAGRNLPALLDAIDARAWPPLGLAPLIAAALLAGADINDAVMRRGIGRLARATGSRWKTPIDTGLSNSPILAWQEAVLLVCERAIVYEDLKPLVAQILNRAIPKPELEDTHHFYRLRSAGARHARAYVLRELISEVIIPVDEWLPPPREVPRKPDRKPGRRQEKSPEEYWNEALAEATSAFTRFVNAARITLASLTSDPVSAWPTLAKTLDVSSSFDRSMRRDPDVAALLMRNHLVHSGISGGDVGSLVPQMREVMKGWSANSVQCALDLARTLSLLPNTHDCTLVLLTEIASEIEHDPLRASERVKLLSTCARIALPLDVGLSEWLFGKAVGATGAVDFEARSALAAAGAIAQTGLTGSPAECAMFAARLADAAGAVAESLGISDDFSWDEVAGWVTAASLPMGLVTAARWHDKGIATFDRSISKVIENGSELSLAQRVALATLATNGPIALEEVLGDCSPLPNWLVESALAEQLCEGKIDEFLTAFQILEGRAANDALTATTDAKAYWDNFSAWRESDTQDCPNYDYTADDQSANSTFHSIQTQDDIRKVLIEAAEGRSPSSYQFCQIAERIERLNLRVPFLEIALELGGQDGELGEAVPRILERWSSYPPVMSWMRDRFPTYITGVLDRLFHWNYGGTETLEAALEASGLEPASQAHMLLDGIVRQGEHISTDFLYALTGLIAARTPAEDRSVLFDKLLSRIEDRTSHPPRIRLTGLKPPQDISESVARCLFAAMGDMDRRTRWRASHAAIALLRGKDPAWERLVACLASSAETIFAGAPFYRYAALEQLMVVLQRAAITAPKSIVVHAPLVLKTIREETHVIVRELGRSVLLAVDGVEAWKLTDEERLFVEQLNRSQLAPVTNNSRFPHGAREDQNKRRYQFDSTDAIPYWYQPIARLFGMRMETLLDRLEYWIHEKWGYAHSGARWINEPRLERIRNSHESTSRRHGELPTLERLDYHIEWHALMCAVGELVVEHPLAVSREDNEFEAWIEDNLPTFAPYWLADLRTPPPLEPRFWGIPPTGLPRLNDNLETEALAWGNTVSSSVFDAEIKASGDLVVAAEFELFWGNASQRVTIDSALVSSSTSLALAQALANTRDRMDFALPDGKYHDDINEPGFHLEAWLRASDHDPSADRFDERRGATASIPVRPLGVEKSYNFKQSWELRPISDAAINIASWGSLEEQSSHGWRATASRELLGEMLSKIDRDLILLVEISRQVQSDDVDRNKIRWVLYVFNAQGDLKRVERERRSLGRFLVRRENLEVSVDTLGRWILHRIAELDRQRNTTDKEQRAMLDREVEMLCAAFRKRDHDRF